MTTTLAISDLWLDANQGLNKNDRAFGYIGTDDTTTDEDGDDCEYCGWFLSGRARKPASHQRLSERRLSPLWRRTRRATISRASRTSWPSRS